MKRLILIGLLVAGPAMAQTPTQEAYTSVSKALDEVILSPGTMRGCETPSQWTNPGSCNVVVGLSAGTRTDWGHTNAAGDILIGTGAELPYADAVGFVNIGNVFCGWRGDTDSEFTQVKCPETK
jgi:hypothetical protein